MFDTLGTLVELVRGTADLINACCTGFVDQMGNWIVKLLFDTVNIVWPVTIHAVEEETVWTRLLLKTNSSVAGVE